MSDEREQVPDDAASPDRSRNALAASTLRALRAGKPVNPPASDDPEPHVESDVDPHEDVDSAADNIDVEHEAERDEVVAPADKTANSPAQVTKTEPTPETRPSQTRRGSLLTAGCAVLAVAALVFAVIAGVTWWTAGHSEQHKIGVARDQVATDARLAIVTVNTSDYRHASTALSNWLTVSTGSLHSQFAQSRTAAMKLLAQAQTVTKATVLDDAVTALDLSKGTATVIASVNVARTHAASTNTVRNRFRATMSRVGGQWKLSNLAVVPVSLS